ncbi:uncharacterized protein LOC126821756 isoform X1 [Patella vulgata]|uniref:uncharacterized protein LOC126821756 isoform X1 n=1 Tax=Patella vulgata TaxID=6465 RepID=UPI0024A7CF44|nr:uncharacterized protein LOC126821756 isoform X1 [Patella vulgata]
MPPTDKPQRYPGECDETHPEIFTVVPKQPTEKKPGQLPQHMIDQFFKEGYVVVDKFFDCEKELDPCRAAIKDMVDGLANKLYKAGKIKQLYDEYGLFERLTHIEREFPGANILLHKAGQLPQPLKNLWTNERLLNVVEQLIGPEISGHPVWNLRTKTPQNEATTVPWHQDSAYLDNRSYKVLQPTAWIPLLNATEQNGCMRVAAGGHKLGKVAQHQCCYGGTWYVMLEEEEMKKTLGVDLEKDIKCCPIPYGGMLLLNNMIPHHSLPNMSNEIRWSLDFRWQQTGPSPGFYDMKETIPMHTAKNPDFKMDWSAFDGVDRHIIAAELIKEDGQKGQDEFDVTIQGPWMKKWELVHMNHHTDKLLDEQTMTTWHKA